MSKARVTFVTSHQIAKDFDGQLVGASASVRLRALIPAVELSKLGFETKVVSLHESVSKKAKPSEEEADLFIVSKIFSEDALDFAFELKSRGKRVIFDYCDNYFEEGEYQSIATRSLLNSDYVFTNTRNMSLECEKSKPGIKTFIIPDLIEGDLKPFKPIPKEGTVVVLSFGHQLVCNHITKILPELAEFSKSRSIRLEIVTAFNRQTITWFREINPTLPDSLRLSMTMWNEYQMIHSLHRSDIVIIPSEYSLFNKTKSPNRLIESVIAGKPVVSFPLPEYEPYGLYLPVVESMLEGLRSLIILQDRDMEFRITGAQARALSRHSAALTGYRWSRVLNSILAGVSAECFMNNAILTVRRKSEMCIDYAHLRSQRRGVLISDDHGLFIVLDFLKEKVLSVATFSPEIKWVFCKAHVSLALLMQRFVTSRPLDELIGNLVKILRANHLIDLLEAEMILLQLAAHILFPGCSLAPAHIQNEILDRLEFVDDVLRDIGFTRDSFERSDEVKLVLHSALLAVSYRVFGTNDKAMFTDVKNLRPGAISDV